MFQRRDVPNRGLKTNAVKLCGLMELAPNVIYAIEPSTLGILGRNHKAAELDGYSDDDIAQMAADDLYPSEDHSMLREWFERGAEAGGVLRLHTLQRKMAHSSRLKKIKHWSRPGVGLS